MTQQKSTRFSAAKVANFGVVMAEMMVKMGDMEKEIKRLRHHVSVLSKKNHELVKNGKSEAAAPIASVASFGEDGGEEKSGVVAGSEALVEEAEVVAVSVAGVEEAEVAVPVVRLPVAVKGEGSKKRRVEVSSEEEEGERREEILIAPLGPRAECGGLLRRVGKESVFRDADPRFVAGGNCTHAIVGVSRQSDAWRQSPGASRGYQLRPRGGRGNVYRGRGRGRGF